MKKCSKCDNDIYYDYAKNQDWCSPHCPCGNVQKNGLEETYDEESK